MVRKKTVTLAPGVSSRSDCPLSCALDLFGDRWSLLIIRDLFFGHSRYSEFLQSDEKIPTNILADRLRRLERSDLIRRVLYQARPKRYEYQLTERGQSLGSVVKAVVEWGSQRIPGTRKVRHPVTKSGTLLRPHRARSRS